MKFMASKTDPLEETFFLISKFSLKLLGYWPEMSFDTLNVTRTVANFLIITLTTFGEFVYAGENSDKLTLVLDALCPSLTKLVTCLKLFLLLWYRKQLRVIIIELQERLESEKDKEKIKIIREASHTNHINVTILFVFANVVNSFYCTRPMLSSLIDYSKGLNTTWELPFKTALPYTVDSPAVYLLNYILSGYSGLITAFGFSGVDGCFIGFCLYLSSLFKLIQHDLRKAFANISGDFATPKENQRIYNEIRRIVAFHNQVMELSEKFASCFIIIILAHFLSAAIVICISSINLILASNFQVLLYVFYNTAAATQLYVYCSGGTFIEESSQNIAQEAYFCEWYKCNSSVRKSMLLIILRAQRGTRIAVPFFALSLQTFGMILRTSCSYITLLKTFL